MLLKELLKSIHYKFIYGFLPEIEVNDIAYDSRKVTKNSVFVCLKGANYDGHEFIKEAVMRGASAIVVSQEIKIEGAAIILVQETRKALAYLSAKFFGYPSQDLKIVAITGTKGKTSTALMIQSILENAGIKTAVIGTLGVVYENKILKTQNTTPESYEIQKCFKVLLEKGCQCVVIEASSLGLKHHRMDAIKIDCGVFTNFSRDHIGENEHSDMQDYLESKKILLRMCEYGFVNYDDVNYEQIVDSCECELTTFGFNEQAQICGYEKEFLCENGNLGIKLKTRGILDLDLIVGVPGEFNAYNALAAIGVCKKLGASEKAILEGLKNVWVKGRLEKIEVPGNYSLFIDYAHNAVSMESLLNTLRIYKPNRLIVLFGAGGGRSRDRRYEMGEVASLLADFSILTEDNSRNEDVKDIIKDIEIGMKKHNGKYIIIENRVKAIEYAIKNAQSGDIIVLAGKGHEDYQEIKGIKYHLDEREVVKQILQDMK